MNRLEKEQFIRQKAVDNQSHPEKNYIYWSRHAIVEMVRDELTRSEVEEALQQCAIIENYPVGHRPLPDCLVLAYQSNKRPLHAVVAIDESKDRIFVIKVYLPSEERWHHDWRTRK